jgi:hypothetical protein
MYQIQSHLVIMMLQGSKYILQLTVKVFYGLLVLR